jgi:hypothetical protein
MTSPRPSLDQHLPVPRRRALNDLADHIIAAEVARMGWTDTVRRLRALGQPCRLERCMLRLAEERLGLLRRSQVTLVGEVTLAQLPAQKKRRLLASEIVSPN